MSNGQNAGEFAYDNSNDGEEFDLFEHEMNRYREVLAANESDAFRRYGYTMLHSLPPVEQVVLLSQMGFAPVTAGDHYAQAAVAIEKQDYAAAAKSLETALGIDANHYDALYNLALCKEKLGQTAEARKLWAQYAENAEHEAERHAIEAHLAELSA